MMTLLVILAYIIVGYAGASLTASLGLRQRWGVLCIAVGVVVGVVAGVVT